MRLRFALCVFLALLLAACSASFSPLVVERSLTGPLPSTHTVSKGETVYSIALRYEVDYWDIARLNNLDQKFSIRPGQKLQLRDEKALAASGKNSSPLGSRNSAVIATKTSPVLAEKNHDTPSSQYSVTTLKNLNSPVASKPVSIPTKTSPVIGTSTASASPIWKWPAKGRVISRFGAAGIAGKGLDIAGRRGDSVVAAADGTVVYAGAGLVGYGKLLIVRHNDNFISAYAHNDRFLVAEGERVVAGQAIAEMGSSGSDREKLHFEIREHGKPVDPMRYLP